MDDEQRNLYIDCAVRAVVEAGNQLLHASGERFIPFFAKGGHEITPGSISVEAALQSAFEREQLQYKRLKDRNEKNFQGKSLPNLPEGSDIQVELERIFGESSNQGKYEFFLSDCPDGSTKLRNYQVAAQNGLPLSHTAPTSINMTLFEKGTTFDMITANINYCLAGDLTVAKKYDSGIIEILWYPNIRGELPLNVHPININPENIKHIQAEYMGTICAQIMTNDNLGCADLADDIRKRLRALDVKRVRFESSGSTILDHHLALYYNAGHILIDPRGLYPEDGPVLHPVEAASHYLHFKILDWETQFKRFLADDEKIDPADDSNWRPLKEFDLLKPQYITKGTDNSIQYKMVVGYYRKGAGDLGRIQEEVTEAVAEAEDKIVEKKSHRKTRK